MTDTEFDIFLVATPGLEAPLAAEAAALGWRPVIQPGGVTILGTWRDVWRANLMLRGATRVLARIGGSAPCIWRSWTSGRASFPGPTCCAPTCR